MGEFGFYHPTHGYRQYIGNRPDLAAPWEEVPLIPGAGFEWDEGQGKWVASAPAPITVEQVKAEAQRRILAICPEWKQRNLTAQAVILAKKGASNWTPEEQAAWDAGEALWMQIAAIRAASDVIEAMDPIPQDFTADGYWPD